MPLPILTILLNERDGSNPHTYWRIGTAKYKSTPRECWTAMRDGHFCAIGWAEIDDLSSITKDEAGKQALRSALQSRYQGKNLPAVGNALRQLFDFRFNVAVGDLVLAADGASILGIMSQDACNSATILYPTTIPGVEDVTIEMHIPSHQKRHVSVIQRPVDLLQLDALLGDARERNSMRMRVNFTEKLIYMM
jgi:hypothetical protein